MNVLQEDDDEVDTRLCTAKSMPLFLHEMYTKKSLTGYLCERFMIDRSKIVHRHGDKNGTATVECANEVYAEVTDSPGLKTTPTCTQVSDHRGAMTMSYRFGGAHPQPPRITGD
jgi:hypothetical protein